MYVPNWRKADMSPWAKDKTDRAKIHDNPVEPQPVPCRICEMALSRLTLTLVWCHTCERAFCPDHGSLIPNAKISQCVVCTLKKEWRT